MQGDGHAVIFGSSTSINEALAGPRPQYFSSPANVFWDLGGAREADSVFKVLI